MHTQASSSTLRARLVHIMLLFQASLRRLAVWVRRVSALLRPSAWESIAGLISEELRRRLCPTCVGSFDSRLGDRLSQRKACCRRAHLGEISTALRFRDDGRHVCCISKCADSLVAERDNARVHGAPPARRNHGLDSPVSVRVACHIEILVAASMKVHQQFNVAPVR